MAHVETTAVARPLSARGALGRRGAAAALVVAGLLLMAVACAGFAALLFRVGVSAPAGLLVGFDSAWAFALAVRAYLRERGRPREETTPATPVRGEQTRSGHEG